MRRCCLLLALVGCGRLGFDPLATRALDGALGDGVLDDGVTNMQVLAGYIKASNTEALDDFGYAIALSADGLTLAIGAPQEDSGSTNQSDNTASNAGAVYIFVRTGDTWVQQAYLKPTNVGAGDLFGAALALAADGNTLVATAIGEDSATVGVNTAPDEGAQGAGAAFVFVRSGTTWSQQAYVKASNSDPGDSFGQSAALSATGDILAVGASSESSPAVGINNNQALNTAPNAGAVYVYRRTGTIWTQDAYVKASNTQANDNFGSAVALSATGDLLVVGAPGEDSASQDQTNNTATDAGAAYVFVRAITWSQQAYLKAPVPGLGDFFAKRVSLAAAGDRLLCASAGDDDLIGNSGAAFVLSRSGTAWALEDTMKASNAGDNDQFGIDVGLARDGNTLIVGAALEDGSANQLADVGAAYAFDRIAGTWTEYNLGRPPAPTAGDNFGFAVAISGDGRTQAVSMPLEDGSATGVNGVVDEAAMDSGAVLVTYD